MSDDETTVSSGTATAFLDLPYTVVDAMLGVGLKDTEDSRSIWRWRALTHGSSRHSTHNGRRTVMMFSVYAVALTRTQIVLDIPDISLSQEEAHHTAENILRVFCEVIQDETNQSNRDGGSSIANAIQSITAASSGKRPRGAPTDDDNDWARAQMTTGADREQTYQEWAARKKLNPDDTKNRDSFGKAIRRKRKGKEGNN